MGNEESKKASQPTSPQNVPVSWQQPPQNLNQQSNTTQQKQNQPIKKGETESLPPPKSAPKITGPKVEKQPASDLQVMIVGLDNAGKSSILERMKVDKDPGDMAPTAGFQVEKFKKGKTNLTVYDMAGATSYRSLWDDNMKGVQVLVFVVDSSDRFRIVVARGELENLLELPAMEGVPVLVFANKNDLPNSLNYSKVSEQMGLEEISDRSWNIVSSSAITGAGINDGVDWILKNYKRK